jgi:drug/metabolite transporter (DMT)-like permease
MATILGNTQVFWMTGFGRLIHGERFSRGFKVAVPLAFLGVVTVVGVGSEVAFTGSYLAGVGFGLATAVAYSTYMLCLRHATRLETAGVRSGLDQTMVLLGWICGLCAVILGVVAIGEGERLAPRGTAEVLGLVGVGVVPQVLGWLVIASGMRVLPASRAGLLLLLQPALATVWGAIWFGEVLTPLQILGAGLTLTAVYIGTVARRGGASVATPPIRDRSPTTAGTPP